MAWYLYKHEQDSENALPNNTRTEGQFIDKSATTERNTKCLYPPGLCFALFSIVFGAVFALSNYLLGYSFNIMWVDTVAVTPFILFGLEQLVHQKRSHFYILSLFYAVWSNYYIGYMVCVFACLYLIYLIVAECDIRYWPVREIAECIARFAVSSLAAGGMAAVLLLPAFLSLRNATSSQPPEGPGIKIYTNAISLFRAHFVDFFPYRTSYDRGAVNIYSGVIVLILLAVFLLDRSIKLRKRMSLAVLLGILLFSFSFSPLNYAWHGFHIETGVPNRFAFLYSILLCKICHEAMCRIYRTDSKTILKAIGIVLLFSVAVSVREAVTIHRYSSFMTIGLLIVYALLLYFFNCFFSSNRGKDIFKAGRKPIMITALLLCALMTMEAAAHCQADFYQNGGVKDKSPYISFYQDVQEMLSEAEKSKNNIGFDEHFDKVEIPVRKDNAGLIQNGRSADKINSETKRDHSFFRTDIDTDIIINFGAYTGTNGIAMFNSDMQGSIRDFFEYMHVFNTKNTVRYVGVSGMLRNLLAQRYLFSTKMDTDTWNGMKKVTARNGLALYENPNALSIGFMVPETVIDWTPVNNSGMESENSFARLTCGIPELYEKQLDFQGQNQIPYEFYIPDEGMVLVYMNGTRQSLTWNTPEYTKTYYGFIDPLIEAYSHGNDQSAILQVETELGGEYSCTSYTCTAEKLKKLYSALSESQLENILVEKNHLTGSIDAKKSGILLLSIPYDKGWKASVDGQSVETIKIGGALTGIRIKAGMHDVSMRYTPPGLIAGGVLSVLSLIGTIALLIYQTKKQNDSSVFPHVDKFCIK